MKKQLDFLLVGFVKSGTSTLDAILRQDRRILLPLIKETQYISNHREMSLEDYWQMYYPEYRKYKCKGAIEPTYCCCAKEVYETFGGDLKIIFMMRNPVMANYSQFKMGTRGMGNPDIDMLYKRYSSGSFPKMYEHYVRKLWVEKEKHNDDVFQYDKWVKEYLKYYAPEQMHFILFEDFVSDPQKVMNKLLRFLCLEPRNFRTDLRMNEDTGISKNCVCRLINKGMSKCVNNCKIPFLKQELNKLRFKCYSVTLDKSNYKMTKKTEYMLAKYYKETVCNMESLLRRNLKNSWGGWKIVKEIFDYLKLNLLFLFLNKQLLRVRQKKEWKMKFYYFLKMINKTNSDYRERWKIIEGFTKSNIEIVKEGDAFRTNADPILICVLLNEMERIRIFLSHYRKIGIKKFAILDNGSTDGTLEYLKTQSDVIVFQTKDKFESKIKVGWINRIISYFGTAHWYLVVDADELLVWHNAEEDSIQNVIKFLKKEKTFRARALMVDMYTKEMEWNKERTFEEIYPLCKYFDYNTYYEKESEELYLISGGPRKRKLGMEAWLTKYPLFKLQDNEIICNPHSVFPYNDEKTSCFFAILHYKFLTNNDRKKLRKYAKLGNYASNSAEYKMYLQRQRENINNFVFYFDDSAEYESSKSISKIGLIDRINDDFKK